jgi:hypothetical protein
MTTSGQPLTSKSWGAEHNVFKEGQRELTAKARKSFIILWGQYVQLKYKAAWCGIKLNPASIYRYFRLVYIKIQY